MYTLCVNLYIFDSIRVFLEEGASYLLGGGSKFLGGPVSFQIYWPPGPLHPQA